MKNRNSQCVLILQSSFEILHSRLLAEEVGFEPTVPVTRYGGFQDRCLKPLGHPSGMLENDPPAR